MKFTRLLQRYVHFFNVPLCVVTSTMVLSLSFVTVICVLFLTVFTNFNIRIPSTYMDILFVLSFTFSILSGCVVGQSMFVGKYTSVIDNKAAGVFCVVFLAHVSFVMFSAWEVMISYIGQVVTTICMFICVQYMQRMYKVKLQSTTSSVLQMEC